MFKTNTPLSLGFVVVVAFNTNEIKSKSENLGFKTALE